eukprot:gnl/TRDRNA2_/TRDRNA2_89861_c0_seq1.p1 gnl/TRDRNA2_/TRDRNA2_89861_c0~~gnl/TRDRNA2_/TRDRNA2_89861_c0_seq1.p1  ORF type:complete len:460 (+),score=76.82 gnl/TRDRNA2_/TRDRNA2_89861_c0_seq1:51-1382(+)
MVVEKASCEYWSAAVVTMQGWRKNHEDRHILWSGATDASGEIQASPSGNLGVFAVLDGHGGEVAAHIGCDILQKELMGVAARGPLEDAAAVTQLQAAFLDTDASLRGCLAPEDRSGSTVVAAVVSLVSPSEYQVHLAHAGDSRVVVCAGGGLVCSVDHKPEREDEVARIQAAGGTVEHGALGGGPLRVDGQLAVSRALGDFQFKPVKLPPAECKVTAMPEVQSLTCAPGDWLLLACDGVWDVYTNEEARDFITDALQAPQPVDGSNILVDLMHRCLERGSKDNMTACLVQLKRAPAGSTGPPSRELLTGSFLSASEEVKAKYVTFFETHGFPMDQVRQGRTSSTGTSFEATSLNPKTGGLRSLGSMAGTMVGEEGTTAAGAAPVSPRGSAPAAAPAANNSSSSPQQSNSTIQKIFQAIKSSAPAKMYQKSRSNTGGASSGSPK